MKSRSSGFTLVELIASIAVLGFLLVFSINVVRASIQRSRDNDVLQNLQNLWVAANHYFLDKMVDEVSLADLAKANSPNGGLAALTCVRDEDYLTVNDGTIKRSDPALTLTYDGGRVVSYATDTAASTKPKPK
ncbi:MAG: type II secretion system GspH family protein [Puniceicoccales bacterium]|jgi:prepilin-type N-terminal cleavage/methylation domain-containing protein|nr:type II secretion system GspH family protein [Puniceicoccales bacterium]